LPKTKTENITGVFHAVAPRREFKAFS